jgi:hypothetical protein
MPSAVRRDRPVRTVVTAGLAVVAASLAITASASAASLTASLSPTTITQGKYFTIKLTGAGVPNDPLERAIAFTQPNTPACKSSPQLEGQHFRYRISSVVSDTPFTLKKTLQSSALGKRRVCAYLYSTEASTTVLRATTTYKVVLPLCHRGQRRGCRRH